MTELARAMAKHHVYEIVGWTHELQTYAADDDDRELQRRVDYLLNTALDVQKWLMLQDTEVKADR